MLSSTSCGPLPQKLSHELCPVAPIQAPPHYNAQSDISFPRQINHPSCVKTMLSQDQSRYCQKALVYLEQDLLRHQNDLGCPAGRIQYLKAKLPILNKIAKDDITTLNNKIKYQMEKWRVLHETVRLDDISEMQSAYEPDWNKFIEILYPQLYQKMLSQRGKSTVDNDKPPIQCPLQLLDCQCMDPITSTANTAMTTSLIQPPHDDKNPTRKIYAMLTKEQMHECHLSLLFIDEEKKRTRCGRMAYLKNVLPQLKLINTQEERHLGDIMKRYKYQWKSDEADHEINKKTVERWLEKKQSPNWITFLKCIDPILYAKYFDNSYKISHNVRFSSQSRLKPFELDKQQLQTPISKRTTSIGKSSNNELDTER